MAGEQTSAPSIGRWMIGIGLFVALIALAVGVYEYTRVNNVVLRFGASQRHSEAHEVAKAIAAVVERNHPHIRIELVETGGSSESVQLMSEGKLDLATVQADVVSRGNIRMISILYPALFQLVVRTDSGIETLKDLEGKTVALPPITSGQYRAFWFLANHFGLAPEGIDAIPMPDRESIRAIKSGHVDAIFRVRGSRTEEIRVLVTQLNVKLLPIDQGEAMRLRQPAVRAAEISKGAYRGFPPMPAENLPTVAVDRLLLARDDVDPGVIRDVTAVLFEEQRNLMLITPLLGFVRQPRLDSGTLVPLHEGARSYYDREKPSFLEEKAEYFAFLLTGAALLFSLLISLKRRLDERRKSRVEVYNTRLIELERSSRDALTIPELNAYKDEMMNILAQVVEDMKGNRINAEGLQFFAFTWESVNATINDHEEQLRLGTRTAHDAAVRGQSRLKRRTRSKRPQPAPTS